MGYLWGWFGAGEVTGRLWLRGGWRLAGVGGLEEAAVVAQVARQAFALLVRVRGVPLGRIGLATLGRKEGFKNWVWHA